MKRISCGDSEAARDGLKPVSGITNWIAGEVLNPDLPPITAMTWGYDDGTEIMRDEIDADGCRHWLLETGEQHDPADRDEACRITPDGWCATHSTAGGPTFHTYNPAKDRP